LAWIAELFEVNSRGWWTLQKDKGTISWACFVAQRLNTKTEHFTLDWQGNFWYKVDGSHRKIAVVAEIFAFTVAFGAFDSFEILHWLPARQMEVSKWVTSYVCATRSISVSINLAETETRPNNGR
jgi:hypothetical protein